VIVEHLDFEDCIKKYDTKDTLFFIDPPYYGNGTEHYYCSDFKLEDHKRLLQLLKNIRGKFVLTTYYNDLYVHELKDFNCVTIETSISVSVKISQQRTHGLEYIYMNFEPEQDNKIFNHTLVDFESLNK
jgi:DNA adenine methylase